MASLGLRTPVNSPFTDTTLELLIKSQDRDQASTLNDAHFTLPTPLRGVQAIRLGWMSMYNLFPNIKATQLVLPNQTPPVYDNVLSVVGAGGFPATNLVFTEGRWTCGLGTLTNVMVRAQDAAVPGTNTSDIRWYLIR